MNVKKLVADYLRADSTVQGLVGRRVVAYPPDNTDTPWVRVTKINAPQTSGSRHDEVTETLLQLDCYAGNEGGWPEADELGDAVRDALVVIDQSVDEITAGRVAGDSDVPDTIFEEARERRIITARITTRKLAPVS